MTKEKRMDSGFAVFNLHCNTAGERANTEFIKQFGSKTFQRHILKRHEEGIMSIFDHKPNIYTVAWITLVTAYVNEDRE